MTDNPVKWRWAIYGLIVGLAIVIASLILEASGYPSASWLRQSNLGFSGPLLITGTIGLVAGLIRDAILKAKTK